MQELAETISTVDFKAETIKEKYPSLSRSQRFGYGKSNDASTSFF